MASDEERKSVKQQIDDGELSINIQPPKEYIDRIVFNASIPIRKKYMKSALLSFCKSCEHCEYCPIKTDTTKCHRFHRFLEAYLEQIKDEII